MPCIILNIQVEMVVVSRRSSESALDGESSDSVLTAWLVGLQAWLVGNGCEGVIRIELLFLTAVACSTSTDIKQRTDQIGASAATL